MKNGEEASINIGEKDEESFTNVVAISEENYSDGVDNITSIDVVETHIKYANISHAL